MAASNAVVRTIIGLAWLAVGTAALLWLFTYGGGLFQDMARRHAPLILPLALALVVLSQVIAPLSAIPILVAVTKLYSLEVSFVVMGLSYAISFAANFWLARRFGRPLVERMSSSGLIARLDDWTADHSRLTVGLSRLLGYYYNDLISYVWGLSRMEFGAYFAASLAGVAAPMAIEYAILKQLPLHTAFDVGKFYVAVFAISGVLLAAWWLVRRLTTARAAART